MRYLSKFIHMRMQGANPDAPVYNGKGGGAQAPAPDPNIGKAQLKLADLSEEQLTFFKTEIWPEMSRLSNLQEGRADRQAAFDEQIQQRQYQIAEEEYSRLKDKFYPLQQQAIDEANKYNQEDQREKFAQQAIGDARAASENAAQQNEQRMRSFGINPASGQYRGMMNSNQVQQSALEAAASTRARNAAEQLGWAKRMDAIGLGMNTFGNQATSTGLSLNAGNAALAAGQIPMQNQMMMGQSAALGYGGAMGGYGQVGTLGVQKYGADVQAYRAQREAEAAESAGFGNFLGALGSAGITKFSDYRLKENIVLVGRLREGMNIYEFEYKPEFKQVAGYGRYRGVMADEVERILPRAVVVASNGYKMVNYSMVV